MNFEQGKIYALVGENGSGKTTFLNSIFPLARETSYCMQQPYLFSTTVFENISYGLRVRRDSPSTVLRARVSSIAETFGISHILDRKATELSIGEAQKVALARTFVLETAVILLDEPAANLDEASVEVLEQVLVKARENGKTIIVATHLLDNAFRLADEVITIHDGKIFPQSYQNFFSGEIKADNGLKTFQINDQISFIVASEKLGRAKVSIDPKEIIISKEKFVSSARNSLLGRVSSIIEEGSTVKLTADCGIKLVSQITHKSLDELEINVGHEVYLTFKTSSVRVF